MPSETAPQRADRFWRIAFWAAAAAVLVRNLWGLASSPPGLYIDEASIGYNAWTILHHGVDEHGASFPLYFSAFGEYKNPVYIYAVAPFLAIFGATATAVRLPAALFGLITAVCLGDAARRVSGSRAVGVVTLLGAAATPWLTLESRVGFEVISMVACVAVMLWCLSCVGGDHDRLAFTGAGIAAGVAIFAYSTGRLEVGLLLVASALWWRFGRGYGRGWVWMVPPVAAGYALLVGWGIVHPGALFARLNVISITTDNPPFADVAGRFLSGYATYLSPAFLFIRGDQNLRQSTGYEGVLLITTLPILIAGVVTCIRRWREPLPRFVLLGLLLGPVSAALTIESVPHALRDSVALPFWVLCGAYGLDALRPLLRSRRSWATALAAAVAVEVAGYHADLFGPYAQRAELWFDAADNAAIARAHDLAGAGHTVWLSQGFLTYSSYANVCFITLPPPPDHDVGAESQFEELRAAGFVPGSNMAASRLPVRSGDVLILFAGETPPAGSRLVETESVAYEVTGSTGTELRSYPEFSVWQVSQPPQGAGTPG